MTGFPVVTSDTVDPSRQCNVPPCSDALRTQVEATKGSELYKAWKASYELSNVLAAGSPPGLSKACAAVTHTDGILVDSCATIHISGGTLGVVKGSETMKPTPFTIDTVNGPTSANSDVTVKVPGIGKRAATLLEGSPDLLSLGELILEGNDFHWKYHEFGSPTLTNAFDGTERVKMAVQHNCPIIPLEESANSACASLSRKSRD